MPSTTPRHVVVAVCLVALGVLSIGLIVDTALRASEPFTPSVGSRGGAPASNAPPEVLVLVGGTLVEGGISESASGWVVERPKGRFVVPFERVLLTAVSRDDAYRKRREQLRQPSPGNHVQLAQWCLRFGMSEQAKTELRDALRLAPEYRPARELLKDVEQLENRFTPRHEQTEPAAEKTDDGYDVPDVVSVAGLAPETARLFTIRVQLLLVNGCGNARCHGGSAENGLSLERPRGRLRTQQNLAAALAYVDAEHPLASRLLVAPSEGHASLPRPVFDGPGGRAQRELLEEWVTAAARDLADSGESSSAVARTTDRDVRTSTPIQRTDRDSMPTPTERRAPDLLDRILDDERPDAFDPDAFNRGR